MVSPPAPGGCGHERQRGLAGTDAGDRRLPAPALTTAGRSGKSGPGAH